MSVRLLRKEVLQNVSVIRRGGRVLSPLGGWSPEGEAEGCSREG